MQITKIEILFSPATDRFSTKLKLLCVLLVLFAGLAVVAIYFGIYHGHSHESQSSKAEALKDFNRNAIAANGIECADIGMYGIYAVTEFICRPNIQISIFDAFSFLATYFANTMEQPLTQ